MRRTKLHRLERWQTTYLPVFALWAAAVVVILPPVFGRGGPREADAVEASPRPVGCGPHAQSARAGKQGVLGERVRPRPRLVRLRGPTHGGGEARRIGTRRAVAALREAKAEDEKTGGWFKQRCLGDRVGDAEQKILARR